MAEQITLTAPIEKPAQTVVKVKTLTIDLAQKTVTIECAGDNGEPFTASYPTPSVNSQPSGATLITTLNKMNFSGVNPSLASRVLSRLQTDGYIGSGAIGGTPD